MRNESRYRPEDTFDEIGTNMMLVIVVKVYNLMSGEEGCNSSKRPLPSSIILLSYVMRIWSEPVAGGISNVELNPTYAIETQSSKELMVEL